jgi:uncharacterized membrane protein YgcG
MKRAVALIALLLGALALLAPAWAVTDKPPASDPFVAAEADAIPPFGERIQSFFSDISVGRDGALTVTETIRIVAMGEQFQHGLLRDFPTRYQRDGRTVRVGFEVEAVQRDGREEPWTTEGIDNGVRIRIGSADVWLPDGQHSYTIRYRTTRQLGFFNDFDELYWNVTGNGWAFPIERVSATVRLPQPVRFGQRAFYTGAQASTATDAQVAQEGPGTITIRTTRGLEPYEGLTIAVAWPKGVVEEPPPPSARALWLEQYGPPGAAILALLGLGAFYYYGWRVAGRGPLPGTVVPLFAPPEGMSAAAVRYVRKMGFDNRVFAAALVESGVRGKLRIEESEGGFFSRGLTQLHETGDSADMPPAEKRMLDALFAGRTHLAMDQENHAIFRSARGNLEGALERAYFGKLFLTNKGWAWAGLVLILAAMLLVGTIVAATDLYAEPGTWQVGALGFLLMVAAVFAGSRSRLAITGGSIWLAALAILLGVVAALFVLWALAVTAEAGQVLPMLAPLLALPLAISAFWWMAAPTREGRPVIDQIAGFEKYLSVTEEDRLERLHPPEKTPELFERFLPYAIALDVENRWAARFAGVLAAAAADPQRRQGMGWYSGSSNAWSNPGRFAATVGGALASSVASASSAPGSSSGSGGGGSSGGGGGGGGGGGW